MATSTKRKTIIERSPRERVPHSVAVTLHELSVSGLVVKNSRIPAHVEDFSQTGMRISSLKRLMTYTSVLCEISVKGAQFGVPTIAQVRWVEKHKTGSYSIGLQYLL
jgi:hypothetical protein